MIKFFTSIPKTVEWGMKEIKHVSNYSKYFTKSCAESCNGISTKKWKLSEQKRFYATVKNGKFDLESRTEELVRINGIKDISKDLKPIFEILIHALEFESASEWEARNIKPPYLYYADLKDSNKTLQSFYTKNLRDKVPSIFLKDYKPNPCLWFADQCSFGDNMGQIIDLIIFDDPKTGRSNTISDLHTEILNNYAKELEENLKECSGVAGRLILGCLNDIQGLPKEFFKFNHYGLAVSVGLPIFEARPFIFESLLYNNEVDKNLFDKIDVGILAKETEGFSCSELNDVIKWANVISLSRLKKLGLSSKCREKEDSFPFDLVPIPEGKIKMDDLLEAIRIIKIIKEQKIY